VTRIARLAAVPLVLAALVLPTAGSALASESVASPGSVLAVVGTGTKPQDAVVSHDGHFAYVTSLDDGLVTEIDLTTFAITRQVAIGQSAGAIIWRGSTLLVADAAGSRLVTLDPQGFTVLSDVTLDGPDPIAMAASADGEVVVFSNADYQAVGVLDDANQYLSYVGMDGTPWGVDLFAGDTRAIFANQTYGSLSITTLGTAAESPGIIGSIDVGGRPSYVVVSPDERFAYAANADRGAVDVIDLEQFTVTASYPVGGKPWGVAISSDGDYLYVPDNSGNVMVALDAATGTVLSTTPVGEHPDFVALSPDGSLVLVPNSGSNTVSIIQGFSPPAGEDAPGDGTAGGDGVGSGDGTGGAGSGGGVSPGVVVGVSAGGVAVLAGIGFLVYFFLIKSGAVAGAALGGAATTAAAATAGTAGTAATAATLAPPTATRPTLPLPDLEATRTKPTIDPDATPAELAEFATEAEYRPAVAAHPNAYPDLLVWLSTLGEPAVDAALRARGL